MLPNDPPNSGNGIPDSLKHATYSEVAKHKMRDHLGKLFPNFSPLLHRSITAQGTIQKSSQGYYLQANDKDKTLWTLKVTSQNINLADFDGLRVQIKGNLTPTPNLIEVSEVISFDTKPTPPLVKEGLNRKGFTWNLLKLILILKTLLITILINLQTQALNKL